MNREIILIFILSILIFFSFQNPKLPLYLDKTQPVKNRVKDLMSRMTLEEKIGQMCQYVGLEHMKKAEKELTKEELLANDARGFYPNLHSTEVAKMTEEGKIGSFLHVLTAEEANYLQTLAQKSRLKIPVLIGIDAIHGNAMVNGTTVYPSPISLASSFDTELVEKLSRETALEMRATGSHWAFTPNVDVARDARWGRVGETFGEDPFLVSEMGVAMVEGLQQGDFSGDRKVVACIKHLVGGSQPANGLNASPTDISERTLREVFLPPFKAAIEAGCYSVMQAHNEINGVPCHSSKWLMTDILRSEWGFEGFYVSDWMDIERIHWLHKVAENQKEACFQSVAAGMDMHMHGPNFLEPVSELVREKRLSEERINYACEKILTAKFKLGLFENPVVELDKIKEVVFQEAHQNTALEAARKSIVLLKNDGILPLDKSKYKKILVTGPNANNQTLLGDWAMQHTDEQVITVYEGLKKIAPKNTEITFFDVGENIKKLEESKFEEATKLAAEHDLTILVVGENSMRYKWRDKTAGENKGRANIDLSGKQFELVLSLHLIGKPVIVVLVSGRPLSTPWISENIPVLLNAWEPGSFGGQAIAEILFGKVNPSAKLPISIPRSVGQIQTFYNHKPSHYFHKYVFEKSGALYPFGYGLSYTKFQYSDLKIADSKILKDGNTTVTVTVKNIGQVVGEEIVQLYIRDEYSSATRPVMELKGFSRIDLQPNESQEITFEITPKMLSFYNGEMEYGVESGTFDIMVGGSSRKKDLKSVNLLVR